MYADGYRAMPLKTGYEQVVAQRTTSLFATTADQVGTVTAINKYALTVKYNNGESVTIELGRRYGRDAGMHFSHELVTDLKVGDAVQPGDVVVYNRKYFTPSPFHANQVVMKTGVLCRTALMDNIDTLEDGSVISEEMARQLNSQTVEIRNVEVRFDQLIHHPVQVGESVTLDSMLCTIEDPETAANPLFDEVALDTLKRLAAMTPRAKVDGVVVKIECFYHGEFDDLSENLQGLIKVIEKENKRRSKALKEPNLGGQVDMSFRIRGKPLDPDTLILRFYIEHQLGAGVGDKFVFANQLKTIVSRVMTGVNTTESGEPLDAIFGNTSIEERIVHSPKLIGTTNTLLRVLSKHISSVYRGSADVKAKR